MAAESELERMMIRLMGDGSSYERMLREAVRDTRTAEREIQRAGKGIEDVKKNLHRVGQGIQQFGRQMRMAGAAMSLAITAPIAGIGTVATREFALFEESLSRMVGLVGLSEDTVAGFKGEIIALSAEAGKSPRELAEAMFFITSAGLRGAEAVETLRINALAASAGMGETKSVADAVTSAVNAYGSANLSSTRATEVLTAAVRAGKAEASTFAPVFGQILPTANELGISFEDVGGTLAFLTKSTGSASLAATGLRGVMTQLVRPTKEAEKILEKTGITVESIREGIREDGLHATLMELRQAFESQGIPISKMFQDIEGLNAILQLTGNQSKEAASTIAAVADSVGIVDEAFGAASKTMSFQMNRAMALFKVTLIEIGEILAPITSRIIDFGEIALNAWRMLSPAMKQVVVIAGIIAAAIGPILVVLGMVSIAIGGLVSALATFGPIIAGVAAVAIGVAKWIGIVITAAATLGITWNDVSMTLKAFWSFATAAWGALAALGKTVINSVIESISSLIGKIQGDFRPTIETIRDSIVDAFLFAEFSIRNFEKVMDLVSVNAALAWVRFTGQVDHFFREVLPSLFVWFENNWQEVFLTAFDFATTVMINLGKNIRQVFSNVMAFIRGELEFGDILQGVTTDLTTGFRSAIAELPDVAEREKSALEQVLEDQAAAMNASFFGGADEFIKQRRAELFGGTEEAVEAGEALGKAVTEGAKTEAEETGRAIRAAMQGGIQAVSADSLDAMQRLQDFRADFGPTQQDLQRLQNERTLQATRQAQINFENSVVTTGVGAGGVNFLPKEAVTGAVGTPAATPIEGALAERSSEFLHSIASGISRLVELTEDAEGEKVELKTASL